MVVLIFEFESRKAFMSIKGMYDFIIESAGLAAMQNLCNYLSTKNLSEAKKFALRRGVWFRSLNRVERGVIDLTVRYVDKVKSSKLAKVLVVIINKLESAMERTIDRQVRVVGLPLARKISGIAVSWGNNLASLWSDDLGFARFLVINFSKTSFCLGA